MSTEPTVETGRILSPEEWDDLPPCDDPLIVPSRSLVWDSVPCERCGWTADAHGDDGGPDVWVTLEGGASGRVVGEPFDAAHGGDLNPMVRVYVDDLAASVVTSVSSLVYL